MRRIVLLLVAVSLLLWATSSMAYWRSTAMRWHGDPDEFESTRVRDDGALKRIAFESVHGGARENPMRIDPRGISKPRKGRRISIDFSGKSFFLEK
ncbi:MAG: hypothetical protein ABIJ00_06745 [Candidatus Eisenbacteria bacterium]